MQRTVLPIQNWLDGAQVAGGPLRTRVTRLVDSGSRHIPAGARAVSVSVLKAASATSPILSTPAGSGSLPAGFTATFSCDYPGDTLNQIDVVTVLGDDVMVVETVLV